MLTQYTKTQRQALVDQIIKDLQSGQPFFWKKGWYNRERPQNGISGRAYEGGNAVKLTFISIIKGYKDPRWITLYQADKQGWKIKKGSHGCSIEYYNEDYKKTRKNT